MQTVEVIESIPTCRNNARSPDLITGATLVVQITFQI
jgi:hypothetical protein